MTIPDIDSVLFFFDDDKKLPYLRKSEYIPTENLPENLQEFRLTSNENHRKSEAILHALKTKERTTKQNVNFSETSVEIKKSVNQKKRKKLRNVNSDHIDVDIEDDGKFLFEEAKYSSTTVLEQLGKILQKVWERIVYQNNWDQTSGPLKFEKDIRGFKWRFEISDLVNTRQLILPEHVTRLIESEYPDFCRAVNFHPREWQTHAYKDVMNFSTGAMKRTDSGIFSVPPPTRMSEATPVNGGGVEKHSSDVNVKTSVDSMESSKDEGPAIVQYRRESNVPFLHVPKPDIAYMMKIRAAAQNKRKSGEARNKALFDVLKKATFDRKKHDTEEDEDQGGTTMTKFSLSSKECYKKGWITLQASFTEHEKRGLCKIMGNLLNKAIYDKELYERENKDIFVKRDVDVHYYGDAKRKAATIYNKSLKAKKSLSDGIPFMVTLRDGSFSIYYPSGNVCAVNSFVPGNPSSCYIIVYADEFDNNAILAHFTPTGRSVCYHKNGRVAFISTPKNASTHDENGGLIKKWKWTGRKLTPQFKLKLNNNLAFRCSNKDSMTLFVNIDGESTRIKLSDSMKFSTVDDKPKPKRKTKARSDSPELEESMSKISVKSSDGMPSYQTELNALHERFKTTVGCWMDHYRIAVGLKPPGNKRLICRSAGLTPSKGHPAGRRRSSAPASTTRGRSPSRELSGDDLYSDDSAICIRKQPFKCGVLKTPNSGLPKKGCPIVLRLQMMGIKDSHCKCDRKKIPIITDIEFDAFLESLPKHQLVVISIFQERTTNPFDCTIHDVHYQLNKDRSYPCVQSSCDPYRLLRYPIPVLSKDGESSLLVKRHNVAPGMFIMYLAGKLLFSDYIFDGYGYSKKDFLNQISRTRKEALDERYLPDDYLFTHNSRSRSPSPVKLPAHGSGASLGAYYSGSTLTSTGEEVVVRGRPYTPTDEDTQVSSQQCVTFADEVKGYEPEY